MAILPYPNTMPDYVVVPDLPIDADVRTALIESIWQWLALAIEGRPDEIAEFFTRDYDLTVEQLTAVVVALRTARLRQQAELGDYRCRTQAAFDEINEHGVIARTDYTCCYSCASNDIYGECEDADGGPWRGYVFFHGQDTSTLVEYGETYLGYGLFETEELEAEYAALSDEAARDRYRADVTAMLEETVFPILRRHGIEPQWDGDPATRVLIDNADWYVPICD